MRDDLLIEYPAEGIALLRLNRPEQRNALSVGVRQRLVSELARLDDDESIRCAVLAGGEDVFAAGADIKEMKGMTSVGMLLRATDRMWSAFARFRKPLIAAVRGRAFGGGFELALCADIIVAASDAKFGLPEARLGLMPGGGGTQRLIRLVGKHIAMDVLMSGRLLSGDEAGLLGIVSRVVESGDVEATALDVAHRVAGMAPLALRMIKETTLAGADGPLATGLALEARAIQVLFDSADFREGVDAFLAKRPPEFSGR